jgi:hypothetical protein
MSAFSRARVSTLPVLELEAERFDAWNKAHQESFRAMDALQNDAAGDEQVEGIREADAAAVAVIGEKVVSGLAENTAEGDPIDQALREDHVRDLVGRRHVEDPQGEPLSTIDRLHERIPVDGGTASVALVPKTQVDLEGPTKEEVDAATEEQTAWEPPPQELVGMTDEQIEAEIARQEAEAKG